MAKAGRSGDSGVRPGHRLCPATHELYDLPFQALVFPAVKYWLITATQRCVAGLGDDLCKHLAHSRYLIGSSNYYKFSVKPRILLEG